MTLNLITLLASLIALPAFAQTPHNCPSGQYWDASMNMCMPIPACPANQHWDATMNMCMPDPAPHTCPNGQHWDDSMNMCMPNTNPPDPHNCGPNSHWDEAMHMCMPNTNPNNHKVQVGFHLNQFLVGGLTSGARGRIAAYAPDMWMIEASKTLSARNEINVSLMGTIDKWTVPQNGSPELFQNGESNNQGVPYVDAQHPHSSPIMGLTFSDILTLNSEGDHKLTFFFAPRGEATAGPEAFMHRSSATGNPYAPLSHHLQDVFHITSTVIGAKYEDGKNTFEASTFSGQEPRPEMVNLDMHTPDSYAARYTRQISPMVKIGTSYARVFVNPAVPEAGEPSQSHADFVSANVATENQIGQGTLDTETIWGMAYNETNRNNLNSFLSEFVYQLGKNNYFGRMEVLQRSSDQLEIQLTNPNGEIHWVKAITLGYERKVSARNGINLFAGGSVTQNFAPQAFQPTYGSAPMGFEVHLRLNFMRGKMKMH